MEPNEKLTQARIAHGLTQAQLADRIGVSSKSVSNWERGESVPHPYIQERLADTLGKSAAELGFFAESLTPLSEAHDHLLHQSSMAERVASANTIINLACEAWYAAKPRQVVPAILDLLRRVERYQAMSGERYRQDFLDVRILSHAILALVAFDRLDFDQAVDHCARAYALAEEEHSTARAATYLALMGDARTLRGEVSAGIAQMELAKSVVVGASRGHVCLRLAHAYSQAEDVERCRAALQESYEHLGFAGEGPPITRREFREFGVCAAGGACLCRLHQPKEAWEWLEKSEQALTQERDRPRWEALTRVSEAHVLCEMGELQAGCEMASRGLALALECQSQRQVRRVGSLLLALEHKGQGNDPAVRALRELLLERFLEIIPAESF